MIKPGYTRVSEIISKRISFAHINPQVLEAKCQIGTRVHNAIDAYLNGIYLPLDHERDKGYFQSFEKWNEIVNYKLILNEERLYCDKYKITGMLDVLVRFENDDEHVLIDWKTSAQESKKSWPVQAGFYRYLLECNGHKNLSNRLLFIKLDKDGKVPKIFEYNYTKELKKLCIAEVKSYNYWYK